MTLTLRSARLHDGHRLDTDGILTVDDGRVTRVVTGPDAAAAWANADGDRIDLGDALLAPGFVDAHCHGGGAASFADDPLAAAVFHRQHGTTSVMASLVSQSLDTLERQVRALAPLVDAGELIGTHLEGPWLAASRHGAHPVSQLRAPAASEVERLVDAGTGTVRMVTLAPELPGGLDAVALLAEQGIVTAVGHTEADAATTRAALEAGATGATHLFNAMPGLHHRHPGPILALLADPRAWLELIGDGVHLDPALLAWVVGQEPSRSVLITDAMSAAGCADGHYALGDLAVEVTDGVARVSGTDTIAGSTLTLDASLRVAIAAGIPVDVALTSLTANPASYLGLTDVGTLRPGAYADAVVLTPDYGVRGVLRRGTWVVQP